MTHDEKHPRERRERAPMTIQPELSGRAQLSATAAQLQTLADLIQRYPAETQLILAAIEDGLRLGPMRTMDTDADH
jgi:hypothetical protein